MNQLAIPVDITPQEIAREKSLGGAIDLCAKAAGLEPKQVQDKLRIEDKPLDKGQWSRWISGEEGVKWQKLESLMDFCGNDAPLLWMLHARGYSIDSLRKRETETERRLRIAHERIVELEHEREVERRLFRDLRTA